ncbi:MBL fold metallo-hydrolase [Methylobacterium sp. J-048]|uniref:MBL fold metallo-hydrolase n=1 Tax=Methylobacterium sp. J-048 TaxID=2836635 RepID=UPI001FB98F9B|nr:MBL fold metallo-hydrolase [Methylobacterium sp. J-048]MCJ2059206.1 MBL fold metallo-hydrolase [Methylobacterium sp. J-048]
MAFKKIIDGAYLVPMGNANAVLLDAEGDLVLIDAGFPGKADLVLHAMSKLGHKPSDLKHLVFTHGHPDHIGSAAALVQATGARTYMHAADVQLAESGGPFRPMTPGRGLLPSILFRLVWKPDERMEPFRIDQHIADGETLPLAGGLRAVHLPGHCAGQVGFLWQGQRLLIAGDVFMNNLGLDDPVGFEDEAEGRHSQRKLASLAPQAVCFGHGRAITKDTIARLERAVARR